MAIAGFSTRFTITLLLVRVLLFLPRTDIGFPGFLRPTAGAIWWSLTNWATWARSRRGAALSVLRRTLRAEERLFHHELEVRPLARTLWRCHSGRGTLGPSNSLCSYLQFQEEALSICSAQHQRNERLMARKVNSFSSVDVEIFSIDKK